MSNKPSQINQPWGRVPTTEERVRLAGQIHTEEDVKRVAKSGEILTAIEMYRLLHNVGYKQASDDVKMMAGLPPTAPKLSTLVLSPDTARRLEILFQKEQRAEATRLLVEECGTNLPFCESDDAYSMERIRFAALKLSEGDLSCLREAIQLGKTDWRDLLMASGFGNDTQAHKRWVPMPK